ncbi:MAG: SPFH domain-containing protein [Phycisphaerales bacterium]|nr:SPFH domain-containing protein [Phycisphaerales bacterium]
MGSREIAKQVSSGWVYLPAVLLVYLAAIAGFITAVTHMDKGNVQPLLGVHPGFLLAASLIVAAANIIVNAGLFTLQPNQAAVLILFGAYSGTAKTPGFHWANPFLTKKKVSLRTRNFSTDKIKVNDSRGNPVEIGVVVAWRVESTAQAVFDVDDYEHFVAVQSEAAVRYLANSYPYDSAHEHEISLRGSAVEISQTLQRELGERLQRAGVIIEEARLSHLAYAPEIAGVMLRRQQAEAVVAARSRIVEGACGMVEMALARLSEHKTIVLDEERKAAMVTNLLVVLCGEQGAQPVVNAGTLYN